MAIDADTARGIIHLKLLGTCAMPMHDWTRVDAGIFHAFHHSWIEELARALNRGVLPKDYYALAEQHAAGFGPDVLTLQDQHPRGDENGSGGVATVLQTRPQTRFTAETATEFYRRKKSGIAIRHVSDDRIVAMIEIVSPGNKTSENAFRAFVNKACELLECRVHLLLADPFPPGPRDPNGIHAAIWAQVENVPWHLPDDKRLTLVAYECDLTTRAYIEPVAVRDLLPNMPLFLAPNSHVQVPLEATYQTAFAFMPRRWQRVLEAAEKP
jgi:hypothetical protein